MGSKWNILNYQKLSDIVGVALLTLGLSQVRVPFLLVGTGCLGASIGLFFRTQKQLREKSFLMLEAIRNRDYSFRLPTYGFTGGERILQDTLNQFGALMGEQKQFMEQRERFYEQILSSVTFRHCRAWARTNRKSSRLILRLPSGFPALGDRDNWNCMALTFRICCAT